MGEQPHAHVRSIINGIFRENRKLWGVRPLPEQRLEISSSRYRIPDVCVIRNTDGKDRISNFTPLLCVEVVSSEDRMSELQKRVDDYACIGVVTTWGIDPWKRLGYHATTDGFAQPEDGILRVKHTPIQCFVGGSLCGDGRQLADLTALPLRRRLYSSHPSACESVSAQRRLTTPAPPLSQSTSR